MICKRNQKHVKSNYLLIKDHLTCRASVKTEGGRVPFPSLPMLRSPQHFAFHFYQWPLV
jgi:hypothetical protein